MKKLLLIIVAVLLCNCGGPSQVTFTYYNTNSPEERQVFIDSAQKFNALIGCEAVKLKFVDKEKMAKHEDNIQEIQVVEASEMDHLSEKTASAYGFDSIAALTFLADGDIVIGRDNLTETCYYKYEDKCIYNKGEILFFHEIGHVFGLLHDEEQSDIMYKTFSNKHTMVDFVNFINRLHNTTNVCKGVK